MKSAILSFVALGLLAQPALAAGKGKEQAPGVQGTDLAVHMMWQFSTCIAEKKAEKATELLAVRDWDTSEATVSELSTMLQKDRSCKLMRGMNLTVANPQLFRGALAGASFVEGHRKGALPSYSALPTVFGPAAMDQADAAHKARVALLAFGECVFRTDSEDARKLLQAEPGAPAEGEAISGLSPYLGPCLPMNEGSQVKFTRSSLRGIIGEAAYAVDGAYTASGKTG